MNLQALVKKYRTLRSQKSGFTAGIDEIDHYTAPLKSSNSSDLAGGEAAEHWKNADVWDFTAMDGANRLAASIHQSVTSPAVRWAKYAFGPPELQEDQPSLEVLEQIEKAVFDALEDSDFYTEIGATFAELVDHGNGFLAREPVYENPEDEGSFEGFDFTSISCREALFDTNRTGKVKNFFRRLDWTASQIVDLCERNGWPVPEDIALQYEKGDDVLHEIVYAIFERPEVLRRQSRTGKVVAPAAATERAYGCLYFRDDRAEALGPEGGYYSNPVAYTPWDRKAGSRWGFGPSHLALPTIKYLNGWMELVRVQGEKVIDPPIMAEERGILSDLDQRAGGLTYVRDPDKVKPLQGQGRFDVAVEQIRDLRAQIRQVYHADDLQLKDSPAMTALEAQIRYELMNRILGSVLTRIQSGLLSQVLRGVTEDLARAGKLPAYTPMMKKFGGLYAIEYQGPLARSQRTDEVAAIERWTAQAAGLSQYFPEALAIINVEKALRDVAQKLGVPAALLRSTEEVRKIVAEQKAAQKAAMQADNNRKNMAAMKDAAVAAQGQGQGIPFPGTVPLGPDGVPA